MEFTSWDAIYRHLREAFPEDHYHPNRRVTGFQQDGSIVTAHFDDDRVETGDLFVIAEGGQSTTRQQVLPEVDSEYAGYVAYRGTLIERNASPALVEQFKEQFTLYSGYNFHILAYTIPGPAGELTEGDRRINWVWYYNYGEDEELDWVLTDKNETQRDLSIPPGYMNDEVRDAMYDLADELLPDIFEELVRTTADPFVQAIYDLSVSQMAFGHTALLGDAAFVPRPHTAAGTSKAAADARALAHALDTHETIEAALDDWESSQLAYGNNLVERGKRIGARSQFSSPQRPSG